ncbi:MAG: flagella basal body P-ring formation protein FlgA [Gammaproteobacteria bacterium]|nr:flagella basal body P-ring formation protein FlgA [Gammaproteobacteria bacterium]
MPVLFAKMKGLTFSTTAMERAVRLFFVGGMVLGLAASTMAFAQSDFRNQSTKEELVSAIQNWVGQELNLPPSQIEVKASDPRLIIKPCGSDPLFQFPLSNQKIVSASCESPSWRLNLRIEVIERQIGLVFSGDYSAGSLIKEGDVKEAFVQKDTLDELEESEVVGRGLKVSVRAGQRVRQSLLAETMIQYRASVHISEGTILSPDMYFEGEAPLRNLPVGKQFSKSEIDGSKASKAIARGEALDASNVLPSHTAVFATSIIARGNLISAEFVQEQVFYGELPLDAVSSLEDLGRATAIRQLSPGQPVRYSDVRPLAAVRKGEMVTLTVKRGVITVSIDMEATERGFIGDRVKLRNTESDVLVDAIITGPGRAERD